MPDQSTVSFPSVFLAEIREICARLDVEAIERMVALLMAIRTRRGRLFILGVGGSAANASHAVNDFRKLAGIEAYAPTDNVSELTARTNDEGWQSVFAAWLKGSRLQSRDAVMIFSVGGGSVERNVSPNLVAALDYAKSVEASILGVVGRDGGYTGRMADVCIVIPTVQRNHITPHAEAFQAVVWHLLVSHPALQQTATKWESLSSSSRRSAVFLDRDGVLNETVIKKGKPYPPASAKQIKIPKGTAAALTKLKQADFLLLVVTNQPDVARGKQRKEVVEQMADRLRAELPLDEVLTCYHDDNDNCDCRKPRPGLILDAAKRYQLDLHGSYIIGDRWRDIDAGANAGCKTIWIDHGYAERPPQSKPDATVKSLAQATDWILRNLRESR
jgi:D-sedoheptulose 7-phosphate isomerase